MFLPISYITSYFLATSARSYSSGPPASGGRIPGARLGIDVDDDLVESSQAYAQNLVNILHAEDIDGFEIRQIVTELAVCIELGRIESTFISFIDPRSLHFDVQVL